MQICFLSLVLATATTVLSSASLPEHSAIITTLAKQAYHQSHHDLRQERRLKGKCTPRTVRIRQEWGSLSKSQRKKYTKAVQCLQSKPARTPSSIAAGAKTRFDDFVVSHINQTLTIHYTANFLSWHRYFTWQYEEALREECGYDGYQPYWDWTKTSQIPLLSSPIFDGSETSMSGNGSPSNNSNNSPIILSISPDLPSIYLPTGTGGGCVTSGPFKNMTVNLGPAALAIPDGKTQTAPSGNPLDYNPRCLKRDLVDAVNQRYANATSVFELLTQPKNIYDFQMQMQGVPGSGEIGVHGGGHYTLGGDPGRDVFVSPGDPMFWLHHGMIDRVWWIWQMQKPYERQFTAEAISGTRTFLNTPPSANGTLDDLVDLGYSAGPATPIRDLLSTVRGPFCYVYL